MFWTITNRIVSVGSPNRRVWFHLLLAVTLFEAGASQPSWQTALELTAEPPGQVDALLMDLEGRLYASCAVDTPLTDAQREVQIQRSADQGATWAVVDRIPAPLDGDVRLLALAAGQSDRVYAAGYTRNADARSQWIVRAGAAEGPWSEADCFSAPDAGGVAESVSIGAAGEIYVAGHVENPAMRGRNLTPSTWIVRQSSDEGRTWAIIDSFCYGFSAKAKAIISTPTALYVAGAGFRADSRAGEHWLVRKGVRTASGVIEWHLADTFQINAGGQTVLCRPHGLCVGPEGRVYAVGEASAAAPSSAVPHWIIRRSDPVGNEWRTTDQFQLRPGELSSAFAITAIANHGLFVIGRAADDGSRCHWLVRQSGTGNPGTWSTVDDFQVCAPQAPIDAGEIVPALLQGPQASRPFSTAVGRCVVADESGNIYAGGSVKLGWSAKAVVRKLSLAPQAQLVQSQLDGAQ